MKQPDPRMHLYISLAKSGLRVVAGIALFLHEFEIAGVLFVVAELLGVAEELV